MSAPQKPEGMHPLVKGAAAAALLTALAGLDPGRTAPPPVVQPPTHSHGVDGMPALCGAGMLPEDPVCVRIPKDVAPALAPLPEEAPPPTQPVPTEPAAVMSAASVEAPAP